MSYASHSASHISWKKVFIRKEPFKHHPNLSFNLESQEYSLGRISHSRVFSSAEGNSTVSQSQGKSFTYSTFRNKKKTSDLEMSVVGSSSSLAKQHSVVVKDPSTPLMFNYPEGKSSSSLIQLSSSEEVASELANLVVEISKKCVEERGVFSIVLSGGSLVKALSKLSEQSSVAWACWRVFWADERVVPLTHPDSNYKSAKEHFLSKVPIPEQHIHHINDQLSADGAAKDYEDKLRELADAGVLLTTEGSVYPRFDLVLLGIGPDGHVASLFPNSPLLSAKGSWVLPITNSPKPPPERITLTMPAINSAHNVIFVVTGQGKAFAVERILERAALPGSLPAQLVRPYDGNVTWLLDVEAASELHVEKWSNAKNYPYLNFS